MMGEKGHSWLHGGDFFAFRIFLQDAISIREGS